MNTMLKTRNGGTKAPGGLYWHFGNWEIKALDGKEVTLPGSAEERYVRIPTVALLVLGPVMGLAFAMFLPFIGFALLATQIVRKIAHTIVKSAPEANTVTATGPKASVKRESAHHDEPLN
jgi:hypothetical protein